MAKLYFYLQGEDFLTPATPVFLVKVGDSKKELFSFKWLCFYAKRKHFFLKPAIRQNEQVVKSMMLNMKPDGERVCPAMMIVQVNVIDLVNRIPHHTECELTNPKAIREKLYQLRHSLNPIGFVSERSDENDLNVLTYQRKNLSPQGRCDVCDEVCPLATKCRDYLVCSLIEEYEADRQSPLIVRFPR